jgi:hypothetical protein
VASGPAHFDARLCTGSVRVVQGPLGYLNVRPTFGANFLRSKERPSVPSFPFLFFPLVCGSSWGVRESFVDRSHQIDALASFKRRGWLENSATARTKEAEDGNWTESGLKVEKKFEGKQTERSSRRCGSSIPGDSQID